MTNLMAYFVHLKNKEYAQNKNEVKSITLSKATVAVRLLHKETELCYRMM